MNNGLKMNIEKCHFFYEVELIGHIFVTKGITPIHEKVKVITEWAPQKNVNKLHFF
jgi:hypothetical protein